jgi:hypothetical protein
LAESFLGLAAQASAHNDQVWIDPTLTVLDGAAIVATQRVQVEVPMKRTDDSGSRILHTDYTRQRTPMSGQTQDGGLTYSILAPRDRMSDVKSA